MYRYSCLYHPTIRIQRLFWKKNDVKKYVKNLELINKDKKKVVNVLGCERSEPGFESRRPESDFTIRRFRPLAVDDPVTR